MIHEMYLAIYSVKPDLIMLFHQIFETLSFKNYSGFQKCVNSQNCLVTMVVGKPKKTKKPDIN